MPSEKKNINAPDETRTFDHGRIELFNMGGGSVGRFVLEPGWKWSQDVKPIAGSELCENRHFGYQVAGTLHIQMSDGTEYDLQPGDFSVIEPGHDAWVTGNEAAITIDWTGAATYAKSQVRAGQRAEQ